MVRLTLKPSWREESCCSLLVVKGGVGLLLRSLRSTSRTDHAAFLIASRTAVDAHKSRSKYRTLGQRVQVRVNGPVFDWIESLDFTFTFDDETKRNGLHTSGGEAAADFVPEQRRYLVAHDTVKHAASLLRVNQVAIDCA